MERSRRSVLLSVPPLWLIGVCLFLPTVRACERMESPATLIQGGPWPFLALLSPYVVAELLAVLAIVALARNRLTPLITRATTALVVAAASSSIWVIVVAYFDRRHPRELAWGLFAVGCVAAAGVICWRARRQEAWTRQARLLTAYTLFTLPLGTMLVRMGIEDGLHRLGYGAYGFLAALVALVVIHSRQFVRSSPA